MTSAIEDEEKLSGDEIENVVGFLGPLFEKFIDALIGNDTASAMAFLANFTSVTDQVLTAVDGWKEISEVSDMLIPIWHAQRAF